MLGFTVEVNPPKTSVYKAVGFNDQATIKNILWVEKDLGYDKKIYDNLLEELALELTGFSSVANKQETEGNQKNLRQ